MIADLLKKTLFFILSSIIFNLGEKYERGVQTEGELHVQIRALTEANRRLVQQNVSFRINYLKNFCLLYLSSLSAAEITALVISSVHVI